MSVRSAVPTCILPVFALTLLCSLSPGITAQKSPATVSGAPLKGVDVKLARYSGAQFSGATPAASTKTDDKGDFAFPILPRGEYVLTVSLPGEPKDKFCYIRLNLAGGKRVEVGYNLAENKAFDPKIDPSKGSTSKVTRFVPLIFVSDGVEPCNGTIVKSKSNITNN